MRKRRNIPLANLFWKAINSLINHPACTEFLKEKAINVYNKVKISWCKKMIKNVGLTIANFKDDRLFNIKILLSKKLWNKQSTYEKYDTVSHELAHAIEYNIKGNSSHSKNWQIIHVMMNGSATKVAYII